MKPQLHWEEMRGTGISSCEALLQEGGSNRSSKLHVPRSVKGDKFEFGQDELSNYCQSLRDAQDYDILSNCP